MSEKHPGGRPLKFKSVEELEEKINQYFIKCDSTVIRRMINSKQDIIAEITKPYTVSGLAEYLETSRQTLINYEERDEFIDAIKKAKAKIEANYEERALIGDANPAMSIFTLKNNYKWVDRNEITGKDGEPIAGPVIYKPKQNE